MKRQKVKVILIVLLFAVAGLSFTYYRYNKSKEPEMIPLEEYNEQLSQKDKTISDEKIEEVTNILNTFLTIPDQRLVDGYEAMLATEEESAEVNASDGETTIQNLDGTELETAIREIVGDSASDNFIKQCSSNSGILELTMNFILHPYTATVEKLSVEKSTKDNLLTYDAAILAKQEGKEDQTVHFIGNIQFNDEGKIDTITASGSELTQFYSSLNE